MITTFYIYALENPKNGDLFYVGCSMNLKQRLANHCSALANCYDSYRAYASRLENYIVLNRVRPTMNILDSLIVERAEIKRIPQEVKNLEAKWINTLLKEGHPLTNTKCNGQFENIIGL